MEIEDFISRQLPVNFSARTSTRADEQVILGLDVKMQTIKFTYICAVDWHSHTEPCRTIWVPYIVYILQLTGLLF